MVSTLFLVQRVRKLSLLCLSSDNLSMIEPNSVILHELKRIMAKFFRHSSDGSKRIHWINWDKCCLPTNEGGLGLRSFKDISKAFGLKLWWRFRMQKTLWA